MAGPFSSAAPWDLVADSYFATTGVFLGQFARSAVAAVGVEPGHAVLDVAAGPGTLCLELASHARRVVAVDFSARMVAHCHRRKRELGLEHAEVLEGDGQSLELPSDCFDRAFSNFGLMFFPDRPAGFHELHRTLKSGGLAAVTAWQPADQSPAFGLWMGAMRATERMPEQAPSPVAGLDDPLLFEAEMLEAGFVDVRIEAVAHSVSFESVDTAWDEMMQGNAPIAVLREKLGCEWAEAEAKARHWVEQNLRENYEYLAPAWLGTGRKA